MRPYRFTLIINSFQNEGNPHYKTVSWITPGLYERDGADATAVRASQTEGRLIWRRNPIMNDK